MATFITYMKLAKTTYKQISGKLMICSLKSIECNRWNRRCCQFKTPSVDHQEIEMVLAHACTLLFSVLQVKI